MVNLTQMFSKLQFYPQSYHAELINSITEIKLNHESLGKLKFYQTCSVNYKIYIFFKYRSKTSNTMVNSNKKGKGKQPKFQSHHKRTQTLLKNLTRVLLRRKGTTSLKIQILKKILLNNHKH